jgi:hypothetical protein
MAKEIRTWNTFIITLKQQEEKSEKEKWKCLTEVNEK